MPMVRVYDFETRQLHSIPAQELAPGMIEVRLEGIEGTVWVQIGQIRPGEHKHPPFPVEVRARIRPIKVILDEVCPRTLEEWEDGFRRDVHPEREIDLWLRIAAVYRKATADRDYSLEQKRDVLRVLLTCSDCPREQVLSVTKLAALSRKEAKAVMALYYGGAK